MTEHHDRDELVELMSRYANMPDTKNWDELPQSVFCEEFTADFSSLGVGAPVTTISRDIWCQQSKQAFAGWTATHHAITNHRIAIDGDRATIWAHIHVEHWAPPEVAAGGPNCWLVVGFYDNIAVANPRGLAPELGQTDHDSPGEPGLARGHDVGSAAGLRRRRHLVGDLVNCGGADYWRLGAPVFRGLDGRGKELAYLVPPGCRPAAPRCRRSPPTPANRAPNVAPQGRSRTCSLATGSTAHWTPSSSRSPGDRSSSVAWERRPPTPTSKPATLPAATDKIGAVAPSTASRCHTTRFWP